MVSKKQASMLPLVLGIFLVVVLIGASTSRSARPSQLDVENEFDLRYQTSAGRAEEGKLYWVTINVENPPGQPDGAMWVQCSILDSENENWILDESQVRRLSDVGEEYPIADNCELNEPNTQTARIDLVSGANDDVTFSFQAPKYVPSYEYYIYCAAYERCYYTESGETDDRPTQDQKQSDAFIKPVSVFPPDNDDDNDPEPPINPPIYPCTIDSDCKQSYFDQVICEDGFCIDEEDRVTVCGDGVCNGAETAATCDEDCGSKITDTDLMGWIMGHKIIIAGIALLLIVIGALGMKN